MTGHAEHAGPGRRDLWTVTLWAAPAFVLAIPLVAMQFSDEVRWGPADFVIAGVLLFGAVLAYELAARIRAGREYRAATAVAILSALLLVWVNLAVGFIGSEDNPANLLFIGVLATAGVGAGVARFHPHAMAYAMVATAVVQAVVAVVALVAGLGATDPSWPRDIFVGTGLFVPLWLLSAGLFQRAAGRKRGQTPFSTGAHEKGADPFSADRS